MYRHVFLSYLHSRLKLIIQMLMDKILVNYTLFFNKNHVFQNEAGLFLIFFKKWGSIVLNLFLNFTESLKKKITEKMTENNHYDIVFCSKLYALFFYFPFFLLSFFTFFSTFFFFFLSQIWGSLFLIVLNFEQKWGSLFL